MSRDVLITPLSGLIDFQNTAVSRAQIVLGTDNNLVISNSGGDLSIGNTATDVFIGDGVNSVDIVFEQNGAVRALAGKTLTLGAAGSSLTFAGTIGTITSALSINPGVATTGINLNNNNLINVNHITISDPGPGEGIQWLGGSGWQIYESPNNLTTNSGGNLQIVTGSTRRATFNTSGQLELPVATGTAPMVIASTTRVANLDVATAGAVINTVTGTGSVELVRGNMADNDQARILVGGTASNAGFLEIATADDGSEPIHVRQYSGVFSTLVRTATLLDGSGNTSFPGTVTAATFSGALTGNAATATALQNARTINGVSFNGTANITLGTVNTTGDQTASGNKTFSGITKLSQLLMGENTFVREYASGYSATHTPTAPQEIGRITFTGNFQNITIIGEIRGATGASVGVTRFVLNLRSNELPSKSFTLFEEEITNLGRLINVRVFQNTTTGLVVIGYSSPDEIQNIGWSLRIQERDNYNYFQPVNSLTAINLTGLTEVSTTSTVRTMSGSLTVSGGVTAALTGNAATATTLQNARTINGVSFNGSANITLATINTTGDQTASGNKTFSGIVATSRGALGTTAGNELVHTTWTNTSSNVDNLITRMRRASTGTDWQTAQWEIRRRVDSTDMAFIRMGGTGDHSRISLGNGTTERVTLTSTSLVVGTTLQVTGTTNTAGHFDAGSTNPSSTTRLNYNGNFYATNFLGALSGNAATATTLATTRAINGVNFNGSAAITVPGNFADRTTNESGHAVFISTTATGNQAMFTNTTYRFNPSTSELSATNFNSTSDLNKKKDIETIVDALNIVKRLRGVTFNWKDTERPGIGVIAQEVEPHLPQVVVESDGSSKTVQYGNMVGLLIEAIKEQQQQIDRLTKIVETSLK